MVAEKTKILNEIASLYNWLDEQIRMNNEPARQCDACGKCCDFEAYGHLLFVTTAEIIYLAENIGDSKLKPMPTSRCPYNIDGICTIYEYRFTGCRIFCCRGDSDFQYRLSESVISKLKSIFTKLNIPYRYMPLKTALNCSEGF
jgi:hypothetical protein